MSLNVGRRGLENHLELGMLVKAIGIFPVAAVGGPTAGLNVSHAIRMRTEHAQESLRVHRACADFHVVGLLKHATMLHPKLRELQNQILEIEALRFFSQALTLVFKCSPKVSRVLSRRSR